MGTVPIYAMIIGRRLEDLDETAILEMLEHQAKQGVDYFTIHAGVLKEHLPYVKDRLIGIVSRGGSLRAKIDSCTNAGETREEPAGVAAEDGVPRRVGDRRRLEQPIHRVERRMGPVRRVEQ